MELWKTWLVWDLSRWMLNNVCFVHTCQIVVYHIKHWKYKEVTMFPALRDLYRFFLGIEPVSGKKYITNVQIDGSENKHFWHSEAVVDIWWVR